MGKWAPRIAAGLLVVGVTGGLVLAAVAQRSVRRGSGPAGGSTASTVAQRLATAATPTDPSHLSPAEVYCLRVLGAEEEYRRDPVKRQGLQNGIVDCVQYYNHPVVNSPAALLRPIGTPYVCNPQAYRHGRPLGGGELTDEGSTGFGMGYKLLNSWLRIDQGNAVIVYAGTRRAGPAAQDYSQGVVIVQEYRDFPCRDNHGWTTGSPTDYLTPGRNGEVRIIDAVGETLKLQAEDGTLFYFDVATRQYVANFPATGGTPAATPAGP